MSISSSLAQPLLASVVGDMFAALGALVCLVTTAAAALVVVALHSPAGKQVVANLLSRWTRKPPGDVT